MIWKAGTYIGCELLEPYALLAFTALPVEGEILDRISCISYKPGESLPPEQLRYLRIPHYPQIHGDIVLGEMVCNVAIAEDLLAIFRALFVRHYPIARMQLVDDFGGDDDASMRANNSSCFNDRPKSWSRTEKSKHALGLAVDINPFYNPMVRVRGGVMKVFPSESMAFADRSQVFDYKISREDICYKEFVARGFRWGGAWRSSQDYQHFEK
ncbi:MAG: M15 family metallopeptidase [Bacteroidales bacterium]|nr:M15 family metallopeptidase [Bacteroidales bacterium]